MLAAFAFTCALQAPLAPRPAVSGRAASTTMKYTTIDRSGIFTPPKPDKPVKVLGRVEELGLLSTVAEAGLLSSAEEAGVFSKLEAAGAFSTIEGLLPLADDLKLLELVESLLGVEPLIIVLGAAAILAGEAGLIYYVPDDSVALIALQAVTGLAAGAAGIALLGASVVVGTLQG